VQLGPQEREEVLPLDAPDEGRNQMQSEVIRCNQWSSEAIRGQYAYTTASAEARAR
jgi:hypothetical protein